MPAPCSAPFSLSPALMFNWIIKKILGSKNQRTVRKLQPVVTEINRIEE